MNALKELKRALIQSHPTFFCPVSSEILDMNNCELIKTKSGWQVVSNAGIKKMTARFGKEMVQKLIVKESEI